ncbi:MAG: gliding motility-associated C-terminal domain-containing protein, partial [Flavobacteriales bacterium]
MKKTLLIFLLILSQVFSAQSDCPTAITVCGNSGISYTPTGPGLILEDLQGCLVSDEHFSVWYTFSIATAGTLTFTIDPNVFADDYDFAVYGPNKTCGTLGAPIRCNFSGADGPTGLNLATVHPAVNNQWSGFMNVLPGEVYYLVVDNYSNSPNGFSLTWGGTATLASPFNDPGLITNPFIAPGAPNANPNNPNEVVVCTNPAVFNFSSLTPGIINGNTNFTVSYHYNTNDLLTGNNAITTPVAVNTTNTYYYSITYTDPTNPSNPINKCKQTGNFKFKDGSIVATDATLTECNNNNEGTAVFNLTTANVINNPTATKKYYPSMFDLNGNTNEITNPYQYLSAGGSVFVLVTSQFGCTDVAEIKLNFYPVVVVTEATLRACFIETNPSTGLFDLNNATVTTLGGAIKKYYPSTTDAINQTNEILNFNNYVAPNGVVYVRVTSADGCYNVAKINLVVIPPVYSTVLVDKVICIEDKTTLDAGPGFTGYEWSTGATTQTISNVGVGTYWVKLKTGDCIALQKVKVYATEQP